MYVVLSPFDRTTALGITLGDEHQVPSGRDEAPDLPDCFIVPDDAGFNGGPAIVQNDSDQCVHPK